MRTSLSILLILALAPGLLRAERLAPPRTTAVPTHAVLDLGSGDDAVIGLHVTAEALREAADRLDEDCTTLILTLDSRGGFLAETPALADLLAKELPERFDVTLVIEEASSTAALIALAAPRLVMREGGVLGGHEPFERLGEIDLDLRGEDLDRALVVAQRCAVLGDRPRPVARALVTPTPLAIDAAGLLVERADGQTVLCDGETTLRLGAANALRIGVADALLGDDDDPALVLTNRPSADTVRAQAVLDVHREAVNERIDAFDEAVREIEALLEKEPAKERVERASDLAARIDTALLTHPRIAALRGWDTLRVEDTRRRLDSWSAAIE